MLKILIKITALALLALGLGFSLFKSQSLPHLYNIVTLFDKDKIVHNFSNMNEFAPTIEVDSSSEPHLFSKQPKALPKSFSYNEKEVSTEEFLLRTDTTALVVLKNEDITHESYYLGTKDTDKRISWSVGKSFLSAIFGIAVEQGKITSINDLVTDYVPSLKGSGYNNVSIKNVLQMSSGVRFAEDYKDFFSDINRLGRVLAFGGSFDDFAASLKNEREPGTFLQYVSMDTHVLGMVLRSATGESIVDYFEKNLWNKIHPEASTYFLTDGLNEPMVLGGLNMRSRDYLKMGKLYRDNGYWNGEQVVPEAWVRDSITPDAPHLMPGKRESAELDFGYGYQWWLPVDADQEFMALGIYDQFIYVNKKANLVIVKNSTNIEFSENRFESTHETVAFFREIAHSLEQ